MCKSMLTICQHGRIAYHNPSPVTLVNILALLLDMHVTPKKKELMNMHLMQKRAGHALVLKKDRLNIVLGM